MNIQLKNIKINLTFSEETIMFAADIFIDGKKAGYAKNDGHGGCTYYHAYVGCKDLIEKAEIYCLSFPKVDKDGNINEQSLEDLIDELLYDFYNKKEKEKFNKKKLKAMENGLIFADKDNDKSFTAITWKNLKIADLLSKENGIKVLKHKIIELKMNGKVILNTNLPNELMSV